MPLRSVGVLVPPRPAPFELGLLCEVFGIDRSAHGVPRFDFTVCAQSVGVPFAMANGLTLIADHDYGAAAGADVVAVTATRSRTYSDELLAAVRRARAEGALVLSVCSGVFVLAAAGVLDGRRATCHWSHAGELRQLHPDVEIDADVLFVDDGDLVTSAGTAAGIDACLHVVRRELGARVATQIARGMVVPPQRDGGQRQFVDRPIAPTSGGSLAPVLEWMTEHLEEELLVPDLARRASMSPRTFARRFVAETGTTPARWLVHRRLDVARRLLEQTDLGVETVARRSGFGSATALRQHFGRVVGIPPADYRRAFSCREVVSGSSPGVA